MSVRGVRELAGSSYGLPSLTVSTSTPEASRDEVRVRPGYRVVEVVDPDGTVVARARATRAAPLDYGIVGHPVRPARAGDYTIWELPAKPLPDEYPTVSLCTGVWHPAQPPASP